MPEHSKWFLIVSDIRQLSLQHNSKLPKLVLKIVSEVFFMSCYWVACCLFPDFFVAVTGKCMIKQASQSFSSLREARCHTVMLNCACIYMCLVCLFRLPSPVLGFKNPSNKKVFDLALKAWNTTGSQDRLSLEQQHLASSWAKVKNRSLFRPLFIRRQVP